MSCQIDLSADSKDIVENRGDNGVYDISRVDSDGAPIDITGYTYTFVILDVADTSVPLLSKQYTISAPTTGQAELTLTSVDWDLITSNNCYYYILETNGAGNEDTILNGLFTVKERYNK